MSTVPAYASARSHSLPPVTTAVPDCLFCRIIAGEMTSDIVAETDTTIAFRDINPQASTHVLVVPRAHYRDAAELAAAAPALLAETLAAGIAVAEQEGIAGTGYRLLFNIGANAGQAVYHVHLHVLGGEPLGVMAGIR
jgi:histidine triad (HIT) family protein